MMAALLVSPPATAEDAATGPFVVHNDNYDGGWYLASDGTKQWLRPDCRDELEGKGATFAVTSFMSFGSLPQASPALDCAGIASNAGLGGAYAVTHNTTYNAGWVIDSGSRWWVNATCRAELEAGGVMFDQKPFSMIASTPLTGSTNSKDAASPTCADLAALFAGPASVTPLPIAGPDDPPVELNGRYSTDLLGTPVAFTAGAGSLNVLQAPNSLVIIDTANAGSPFDATLLLRTSQFPNTAEATGDGLPPLAYGGPTGFPFSGPADLDGWLATTPEVMVSNRIDTTIDGQSATTIDFTVSDAGRTGLGQGCGPDVTACLFVVSTPSPVIPVLVMRDTMNYRITLIDQGPFDPIMVFSEFMPGNPAFTNALSDFTDSLSFGTAAVSFPVDVPEAWWEVGFSGAPVPAGDINLPIGAGVSFTTTEDIVVQQNSFGTAASLFSLAGQTGYDVFMATPTGVLNGEVFTDRASLLAATASCGWVPDVPIVIAGMEIPGHRVTTPESCEELTTAPPGEEPAGEQILFVDPSLALTVEYVVETPNGLFIIGWDAKTLADIPAGAAFFQQLINTLSIEGVGGPAVPPWERGLPGVAPAGTHRVNTIGGVEINVNQETFVDPFGTGLGMFNETGPGVSFMAVVGAPTPGDAPFTTVASFVSHLQNISEVTLSPVADSTLLGGSAMVFDYVSVATGPDPFVPIWFGDNGDVFSLPPLGRIWIAETERGLIALTAEAFDDAELVGSLDLAEQIRSSATFISSLPDPVEQGWLGIEEEPPPATAVVLDIDPALVTPLMVGDIVLSVNGNLILLPPEPGPGVVTVERGGSVIDLDVVIPEGDPFAGISFQLIFPDGPPPDEILILGVFPGGPADLVGIVAGDYLVTINGGVWYDVGPRVVGDTYEVGIRRGADLLTFQLTAVPFPAEAPPGEDPSMSSLGQSKKDLVGAAG